MFHVEHLGRQDCIKVNVPRGTLPHSRGLAAALFHVEHTNSAQNDTIPKRNCPPTKTSPPPKSH